MFNSVATVPDPEPWVVHYGQGWPEERFEFRVEGAEDKPRPIEPRRKSAALVKFRESTLLHGVGAHYNALAWLNFMQGFPGHLEQGMDPDELTHLRAVLQRLVNVYGEA